MSDPSQLHWIDGRLVRQTEPPLRPSGACCYSTARIEAGRIRFESRHLRRLERDAGTLCLGHIDTETLRAAFRELAAAVFTGADGIVRVRLSAGQGDTPHVVASAFDLGREPEQWRAVVGPVTHHGKTRWLGAKLMYQETIEIAREASAETGVDEALLFDDEGHLVEGARTNIVVVTAEGALVTPDPALGAVAGIALEIIRESEPTLRPALLTQGALRGAREIIAVNAVRGARPIVSLDGQPIGAGGGGSRFREFDAIFARD